MLFGRPFCRLIFATWFALGAHLLRAQEPAVPAATDPAKPAVPAATDPAKPAVPAATDPAKPAVPAATDPAKPAVPAATDPAKPAVPVAEQPVAPVGDGLLRFAFQDTPWRDVIKWLADQSLLALHIGDLPPGSFTYSDPKAFTAQEAMDRINLFLLAEGYTLVRSEKLLSLINLADPRSLQQLDVLAKLITPEQLDKLTDHEVVKCVFSLKEIKAADAAAELASMKLMTTPAVFAKTNRLMITETAGKLKSVKLILDAFEPSALSDGMVMKNFPLKHVEAEDILVVARPHLGLATGEMIGIDVSVSTDLLGANIFVTGVEDRVKLIEGLIEALDKPEEDLLPSEEAVLQSHTVPGGNVETIYNVLQTLLAGKKVRLSMDATTSSIVALASPDVQKEISQTVTQLEASEAEFEIIPLKHVDPYFAISLLEQMLDLSELQAQAAAQQRPSFQSSSRGGGGDRSSGGGDRDRSRSSGRSTPMPKVEIDVPKIDADPGNMRLYVRAKKPMMERIKKMVVQLDVPSGSGNVNDEIRIFPMRGKQAEQLVRTAAGFWREANAIVLYPAIFSEASSRRERVVASGGASSEPAPKPSPRPAIGNLDILAGDIRSPKAAIRCQLTPRGMLLECRDTVILDRFYRHLQSVAGPVSSRPSAPVIFYLKYTKPEEALRMLSELLDGGETASLGEAGSLVNGYVGSAGTSALGSMVVSREGTASMTSGTITVVADSRLNRLIVQGTEDDIDVVESYLKIVDKDTGITAVETHGKSHVIELVNTRASVVAATIREAFADRVATSSSAGRSQGGSSGQRGAEGSSRGFQRDSGRESSGREGGDRSEGGDRRGSSQRGGNQKAAPVEPKLTVAVHEPSNSLIVTAPDQLFKQVEELVALIDSRNEQTIRIISHSQAGRVNSVLQQVIAGQPNISSSGSSTTPSRTGSSSPSRSSSGSRTGSSSPSRSSSGSSRSGSSPSSRSSGSSRGSGR